MQIPTIDPNSHEGFKFADPSLPVHINERQNGRDSRAPMPKSVNGIPNSDASSSTNIDRNDENRKPNGQTTSSPAVAESNVRRTEDDELSKLDRFVTSTSREMDKNNVPNPRGTTQKTNELPEAVKRKYPDDNNKIKNNVQDIRESNAAQKANKLLEAAKRKTNGSSRTSLLPS